MRKHLGGVAVAGDLAGLDPDPPGEPKEDEAAHEIDEPAQQRAAPWPSSMSMKSSVTCSSAREASGSPAKISANNSSSVISKAPRSGQLKM